MAVQATSGPVRLAQRDGGGDIDDVLALILHFRSGAMGCVNLAWARDGQPELYAMDVLASDASIWLELGPERFALGGVASATALSTEHGDPLHRSIDRFLELCRTRDRTRVFCAPADAMTTLAVAVACERALAEGGRVAV